MFTPSRVLAVAGLVVALSTVGACSSDKKSGTGTSTTTTPPATASSTPGTAAPSDLITAIKKSGATPDEVRCAEAAADATAGLNCLSINTLVNFHMIYLRSQGNATEAQIKCVGDKLREKGVEEARKLTESGIGAAVYVPCGLPD